MRSRRLLIQTTHRLPQPPSVNSILPFWIVLRTAKRQNGKIETLDLRSIPRRHRSPPTPSTQPHATPRPLPFVIKIQINVNLSETKMHPSPVTSYPLLVSRYKIADGDNLLLIPGPARNRRALRERVPLSRVTRDRYPPLPSPLRERLREPGAATGDG